MVAATSRAPNVERLLDLAEIARFTLEGERVTQAFFSQRIHGLAAKSASTVLRRLTGFALEIGHEIRMERDRDTGGSWLVVPADPQRLLVGVTRELDLASSLDRRLKLQRPRTRRERRHQEYIRERRARFRAASLCIHCATPVVDCAACETCRQDHATWASTRYEDRKARGVCWRCEDPVDGDAVHCSACASSVAKIAAKRRSTAASQGLCSRCAVRTAEKGRRCCQTCLDLAKAYRARSRSSLRAK